MGTRLGAGKHLGKTVCTNREGWDVQPKATSRAWGVWNARHKGCVCYLFKGSLLLSQSICLVERVPAHGRGLEPDGL